MASQQVCFANIVDPYGLWKIFVRAPRHKGADLYQGSLREGAPRSGGGARATIGLVQISFCPHAPSASHLFGTSLSEGGFGGVRFSVRRGHGRGLHIFSCGGVHCTSVWKKFAQGLARTTNGRPYGLWENFVPAPRHKGANLYQGAPFGRGAANRGGEGTQ